MPDTNAVCSMTKQSGFAALLMPPLLLGALIWGVFVLGLAKGEVKNFILALAILFGIALIPLFWLVWPRQKIESMTFWLAAFSLSLAFVDINPGFVEHWPRSVLANGFRISLSDLLLLFLAVLWLSDRKRAPVTWSVPKPLTISLVLMLLWDCGNAFLVTGEAFFAWSLIWREFKIVGTLFFLAHFMQMRHLSLMGYAFAASLFLEALAVLDQRTTQAIFTAELLKTDFALKSAAGSGYVLRYGGTFGHPNTLANFLAVTLFYVWFMVGALAGQTRKQMLLLFGLVLGFATLTVTGSRAGWLGMALVLTVGILLWMKKNGKSALIGAMAAFFMLTVVVGALFSLSSTFRDRITKEDRGSAMVRAPLAETAWNIVQDNPITGVGLGQYTRVMHHYDRTNLQVSSWYGQPVHNFMLLTAAELGIPGLFIHVSILLQIVIYGWQTFRHGSGVFSDVGLTAAGGTIAWTIQEMANPDYIFMPYYLWFVWGAMLAARRIELQRGLIKP